MTDKDICKKCIYYDDFCCHNNIAICVNNDAFIDADMVINAIITIVDQDDNKIKPASQN